MYACVFELRTIAHASSSSREFSQYVLGLGYRASRSFIRSDLMIIVTEYMHIHPGCCVEGLRALPSPTPDAVGGFVSVRHTASCQTVNLEDLSARDVETPQIRPPEDWSILIHAGITKTPSWTRNPCVPRYLATAHHDARGLVRGERIDSSTANYHNVMQTICVPGFESHRECSPTIATRILEVLVRAVFAKLTI